MKKVFNINKLLLPLCILAILVLFGFIGWALSGHGVTGLMRVTLIFLVVFLLIATLGIVFTGLFIWYWRLYAKGQSKKKLSIVLFVMSVVIIVIFTFGFIQTGIFPPSKDVQPITYLAINDIENQTLRFAVGSDAHFGAGTNSPEKTAAMLGQIGDPTNGYGLFFFLGDLVEYGFKDRQWDEALKAFSRTAENVPVRFAPGNHDTLFGGLKRYMAYCGPAVTGAQNALKLWYRVDAGSAHFLLLDVEWSAETFTQAQAAWLEAELQSMPAEDWVIVMSHGFYYASGTSLLGWNWYDNPETISALAPLFEKYGVDIVFSGHNHYLELLQHSGVTYAIAGAFGCVPDTIPTYISPSSLWHLAGQAGFIEVELSGNQATLNFRDHEGNILKNFTVLKNTTN